MKLSRKERITNALLLNSSFIDNIGLMHGKTGIAIFFFHLAKATGNKIYENYAGELIDEIREEISVNTPVDFENGLAGIGWGIEYLVQNGFIEADTDEVLEDFDNRLFQALIYNTPREPGLLDGLAGIGAYFLKRVQNPASNDGKIPALTNKQTLIHLIDELDRRMRDVSVIVREPQKKFQVSGSKFNVSELKTYKKPQTFDICWDYPILLWFLGELFKQNLFNFKVEKIIQRLIEPLTDHSNIPGLQSNRLLLELSLTKLSRTIETIGTTGTIETILNHLLAGINRGTIKSELAPNNASIKKGSSGIAWVYKWLFELTANNRFKQEMEYWVNQSFSFKEVDKGFAGFDFEDEAIAFGLLEGLAGIGLSNDTTLQFNNLSV